MDKQEKGIANHCPDVEAACMHKAEQQCHCAHSKATAGNTGLFSTRPKLPAEDRHGLKWPCLVC